MDDLEKTIRHLFYATSSFVHHFKSSGEFKPELQSWNTQLGSKLAFFGVFFTLKFNGWPCKTKGHLFYTTPSFVFHFKAMGEFKPVTDQKLSIRVKISNFFVRCDLEIWQMTLKNNRAPLQYYIKLCVSFQSHLLIQTWVTVRKHSIWVKISDFWSWNLMDDLENQQGNPSITH